MMNIVLWIGQILLAAAFTLSGVQKATRSREVLIASGQTGVGVFPMPVVRFTAICELLGVLGVILPQATGIAPVLTPVAAAGLGIVMIGAISAHVRLREPRNVALTGFLLLVCVFVAVGRGLGW